MSTGMICDGIAASEAVDSSGEILDIKGCDISDFEEGRGTINFEHRGDDAPGASANDIVGRILFAKKIFSPEDCTDSRQLQYYQELQLPYIYIIYRLFDGSGHPGAIALAAIIRDCKKNSEKNLIGLSIEGTTLKKDKSSNRLLESVARRCAATQKPCNKSATSNVVSDPNDPEVQKKEHQHPLYVQLTDVRIPLLNPFVDSEKIQKAITAGGYNAAPGTLIGGSALQVEDRGLRNRVKAAVRDWDKKSPFKKFLKHRLPEASDDFINRFSDLVQDYSIKKAQRDLVKAEVKKAVVKQISQKIQEKQASLLPDEGLTIRGAPVAINPESTKTTFDERKGILHTPRGSFPMYVPSKDKEHPDAGQTFHNIMNDPKVSKFHDKAMEGWSRLHQHLKAGTLPPEVIMHGVLFSQMSPNCLDADTEALTQRGWIKGFNLRKTDRLLTKNSQTGKLEWQEMIDLRLFPDYEGPLVELKNRSFFAVTTPEHRWLTTSSRGHIGEKTSTTLNVGDKIHRTGNYEGVSNSGLIPDEAELLGWFVTDGHYQRPIACNGSRAGTSRTKYEQPGIYSFLSQSSTGNAEKCIRIEELLARLSNETTSHIGQDGKRVWNLGPKLTKMLLERSPERCLTVHSLIDLSQESLKRLREAMILGDGHLWKGEDNWAEKECLVTGRQEQAEAFQALLTMTGSASSVVWRDMSKYEPKSEKMSNIPKMTGCFVVTALQREYVRIEEQHRKQYIGKVGVWCPVVPNTFFVARRDGKTFVTGNTPVPMQELMYAHLVDAMKHTGKDPRSKEGLDALRSDWLNRDKPQQWPEHSREHFKRLEDQLRMKNDSKGTGRVKGDIGGFMLANNKFKNMEKYHTLHDSLVDLVNRHKQDARSGVEELMFHKKQAGLWNAKRDRDVEKGKSDPGEYAAGPSVPGLAPKTARYTYGMLGGGNVTVPDTHFTRYLFGLDRQKDTKSIDYIKSLLWNEHNTPVMNAIDRYYGKHHDAVKHMQQHPVWGKHFEKPEDAIFPAFWKNWVGILPHEATRGMKTNGFNEATDHRPFWDAVGPYVMNKSEDSTGKDTNLAMRTAKAHHEWVQKYGEMPAMLMYFHYLVPQLLAVGEKKQADQQITKFESLSIELRKEGDSWRNPEGPLSTDSRDAIGPSGIKAPKELPNVGTPIPETVKFNDKVVKPGIAWLNEGSNDKEPERHYLLDHTQDHYISIPEDKVYNWQPSDLVKLSRKGERNYRIVRHPEHLEAPSVVSHEVHGVPEYTHHPEVQEMIHGLDLGGPKESETEGMNSANSFWTKNAKGQRVYVKGENQEPQNNTDFSDSNREALYHNLAKDFYGLGKYVTPTAVITHPRTGRKMTVVQHTPGEHFDYSQAGKQIPPLMDLHNNGELHKLAIMNTINDNTDRHQMNYMLHPETGIKLIDHGLTFNSQPMEPKDPHYLEPVGKTYETRLHPEAIKWLQGLKPEELDLQMRRHGVPEAYINETRRRLKAIQQESRENPSLDEALHAPFVRG